MSEQTGEASLLTGKRVVIVEDEAITQMQLRKILTRAGLSVVGSANNGKEGVEIVLRERPDIVLMDIAMPVMNGLEASRRILAEYRVCLIMLSAFSEPDHRWLTLEIGACAAVVKPITSETLLPQMETAYREYEQARRK